MYLSRLILNPRDRQAHRDLTDCHELHRTLLSAWPDMAGPLGARAQAGLLYRVQIESRTGSVSVLAQSHDHPDWGRLPDGYLLGYETKPVGTAYDALQPGARLRFRLRANPTRRIAKARDEAEEPWVHKRVDLRTEDQQIAWLERKGRDQCGFRLTSVQARDDVPNIRTQPEDRALGKRGGARLAFGSVLFEGELEVVDAAAFRQALLGGIGSGKAYGFGLLSIAAPRR